MRISRETMFMEIAQVVAKRATCFRLNVGAVITHADRIVSIGYNGRPAGAPHCEGNSCAGRFACRETTHAEDNAIKHVPAFDHNFPQEPLKMFVTDSPCQSCAAKIMNCEHPGFSDVYFRTPYRLTEGIDDLIDAGINVFQVLPSGVIMNWKTKEFVNA